MDTVLAGLDRDAGRILEKRRWLMAKGRLAPDRAGEGTAP
jgi:hypothetical protein